MSYRNKDTQYDLKHPIKFEYHPFHVASINGLSNGWCPFQMPTELSVLTLRITLGFITTRS